MELMFEIEEVSLQADILRSLLLAVTDSACSGNYGFRDYEDAFHHLYELAYDLSRDLKYLKDEAFALSDKKKQEKAQVLHMQVERG